MISFNDYQEAARGTAVYPELGKNFVYPTLGLVGEAGEVAEKVKKIIRDKDGIITSESREELKKELGDVLWYLANMCSELDLNLEDVAWFNLQKLHSRMQRGKIKGSGDNR